MKNQRRQVPHGFVGRRWHLAPNVLSAQRRENMKNRGRSTVIFR